VVSDRGRKRRRQVPATTPATTGSKLAPEKRAGEPEAKNKPLGFELRGIVHDHAYLAGRGVTTETAQHFGVGFLQARARCRGVWSFRFKR